jgi:hypothetical protein
VYLALLVLREMWYEMANARALLEEEEEDT